MVFANACVHYAQAGWPGIIPVPPEEKYPPPTGYTGDEGLYTGPEVLEYWANTHYATYSIALRMPDGIIGIDVDHYVKGEKVKRGADQLAEKEVSWGPLPATWSSTARGGSNGDGPGLSRIMFFRVPPGRYATVLGPDIEIIQRHHRYAVVAPSIHHVVGSPYQWYDPAGHLSARMPAPGELAELPETWVTELAKGASAAGPSAADAGSGQALLGQILADDRPMCADVAQAQKTAEQLLASALPGCRHDVMKDRAYHLVQLGAEGHPGTSASLNRLRSQWDALTAGENRGSEFEAMLTTAARKAVTHIGATQMRTYDPCLVTFGMTWAAPAPDGPSEPETDSSASGEPPRIVSVRTYIGAEPFDPDGQLDHTLAQNVLERMYPALRYAADADTWLLRGPWAWTAPPGDLSQWAVTELTWLMPYGDIKADKDTPDGQKEIQRAARRKRFGTTAGANAISRKMRTHVLAGTHPCSVELSALDSEPEILWAGGIPWDLRASYSQPIQADIDPGVPHLHSAGIVPEQRPTPLWDTYIRAVWPDPELRAWALRVLSIAFTGYPDKTLPLLRGDTDRGKTSVISLLMNVLGTYAHAADTKLLSGADRSHASIVMALKGRRLSFIDEAPRSGHQAQERLKQLTGGSALTGNFMQKNPVTFDPTHTLILTANEESEPPLTDPAVRRRVRLIPCTGDPGEVIAARTAIGGTSGAAWRREAPGVLAAMMSEAAAWLADPASAYSSAAPVTAQSITEQIAASQNLTRRWVEDVMEPWEEGTRSSDLFTEFVQYCRSSNITATAIPTVTLWGRQLSELGYPATHNRQGSFRKLRTRRMDFSGSFSPVVPAVPASAEVANYTSYVTGSAENPPDVTGRDRFTEQPVTENPPRSDPPNPSSVTGLTGSDGIQTDNKNTPIHPHIYSSNGTEGSTRHADPPETPSDQAKGTVTGTFHNPSHDSSPSQSSPDTTESDENRPENPPEAGNPGAPQLAASPQNLVTQSSNGAEPAEEGKTESPPQPKKPRAPKPPKRIGPDPELAGPVHALPAAVNREGSVLSCTLEQARQLAGPRSNPDRGGRRTLTVDVETTGYPIGHPDYRLRTVQLGGEDVAVVFDAGDPEHQAVIRELLTAAEILHAHSAVADLVPLERAGLCGEDAWLKMDDTVLHAKLADPHMSGSDADGLKKLAGDVLRGAAVSPAAEKAKNAMFASGKWLAKTNPLTPAEKSGWFQVDPHCETMIRYAASDVLDTAALPRALPVVDLPVLEREREVQRICSPVSHRGLRLDRDHVQLKLGEHRQGKAEVSAELFARWGVSNANSKLEVPAAFRELGITLPRTKPSKQFPEGQESSASGNLEPIAAGDGPGAELAKAVLDYRHHATALSLLLEPMDLLCERGEGRIYPSIYTIEAGTGRMSSRRMNLQQFSRQGGMRACVIADEGMRGISADFSSVEVRVGAALSGDEGLKNLIWNADAYPDRKKEFDLHWIAAHMVWGQEATKENRYVAKRIIFSKMYGGAAAAGARQTGVTEAAAQAVHDAFERIAPAFVAWSNWMKGEVEARRMTYFLSYSGRPIWLPRNAAHAAGNYAIQGTAREALADALLNWSRTRWGGGVVVPIHDEIVAFTPEGEAADATKTLVECMKNELNGVAIRAEAAPHWASWPDAS